VIEQMNLLPEQKKQLIKIVSGISLYWFDDFKLQLRSIDQLTNEEKEYIGKLRYQRLDSKNDLSIAGYNLWLSDSKIFEYLKEKGVCVNPEWFTNGKAVKDE
jgi:hypothetical protein